MNRPQLLASVSNVVIHAFAASGQTSTVGLTEMRDAAKSLGAVQSGDAMEAYAADVGQMVEYWDQVDTIMGGIKAMRAAGEKYLPKNPGETQEDYNFRLTACTKLTNVFSDIVETLSSKPFEEEIKLIDNTDTDFDTFIENVDGAGSNLTVFAANTFYNAISSAIDWIYIDYPKKPAGVISQADQKAANLFPYWTHVLGRNVREVKVTMVGNKETLSYMRIFEPGTPNHVREFVRADNGVVTWTLYEKRDVPVLNSQTSYHPIDGGEISIGIIPLVPFVTGRRDGRTFNFIPTMRHAAELQIEVYQEESDLKFNKKMGAFSMLTGNGVKPAMEPDGNTVKKIAIGPLRVLYAPPSNNGPPGSWDFIQPDASVMKFLSDDKKETIQQLRELGRQPLTAQSGINLTVISAAAAAGKVKSVVGAWALGLKDSLENALKITALWEGKKNVEPQVQVYTEFDEFNGDDKELDTLNKARYPGVGATPDISQETYWKELQRRGTLSPEFDAEKERELLLKELPNDGMDTNGQADPPAPGKPANPANPAPKPTPGMGNPNPNKPLVAK